MDFEYQINEEVTKFVYTAYSAPNSSSPMIRMDAFHPPSTGRVPSQGSFISCFQGNKEGENVLLEPDVSSVQFSSVQFSRSVMSDSATP